MQGFRPLHLKRTINKVMKKNYIAPEVDEVILDVRGFLCSSPDPDTTDPVPVIDDPKDDDLDW